MLDVSLRGDVSLNFARSTHTAITGPPACGASTLLRVVAGEVRPSRGTVYIGSHDVTSLATSRRPLLYVTANIDVPHRWSVEHALVNAVRSRTLDRTDRHHELKLAASKWRIDDLLERRIGSLSDQFDVMRDRGPGRVTPFLVPMFIVDMLAGKGLAVVAVNRGDPRATVCSGRGRS